MATSVADSRTPFLHPPIPLRDLTQGGSAASFSGPHCKICHLRALSPSCGLAGHAADRTENLIHSRKRMKRGQSLYRAGDPFRSLYAIRSGFFKSNLLKENGCEQVIGFYMAGEVIGMDGIGSGSHASSAIALEDGDVCELPYSHVERIGLDKPGFESRFHRILSREIVRNQGMMLLLGSMRAEQRLAAFLLNLSQRFTVLGYSPSELDLSMTREDIGSYLGMTLETVSRLFSRFQHDGLIDVRHRHIRIFDLVALETLMGPGLH